MNSKMKTNSQLPKKQPKKQKQKQTKQTLEQEENHRNGDHVEGYQWEGGRENGRRMYR